VGVLQMELVPTGLWVSLCVCGAVLAPLPAVTGSLEAIFQRDDGAGIV